MLNGNATCTETSQCDWHNPRYNHHTELAGGPQCKGLLDDDKVQEGI